MCSWKYRPKCGPTNFCQNVYINCAVEKIAKNLVYFFILQKTTKSKQS
jgi:hypothetical protein